MNKLFLYLLPILLLVWSCTVEDAENEPEGKKEVPIEGVQEPDDETQKPVEEENYVIPEFSDASTLSLEMSADELKASAAMRDFGVDFFAEVSGTMADPDANIVVSPLSATIFMAMLSNIATDEQTAQIARLFGCDKIDDINAVCRKYLHCLPSADADVALTLDNALWYHSAFDIHPVFEAVMQNGYFADVNKDDFTDNNGKVIADINSWASDKTNGLIPKIIDYLDPKSVAVLANALYFKAYWTNPLKNTSNPIKFAGTKGVNENVPHMRYLAKPFYASNDYYESIILPYANKIFQCTFVLPKNAGAPYDMVHRDALKEILSSDGERKYIALGLPKFNIDGIETPIKLNDVFENMGVKDISGFTSDAMFTIPTPINLTIAQRSYINFTEKGTEGAVATSGTMVGALDSDEPMPLDFNRPFMFFITETVGGNCIFAGKVMNL